MAVGQDGREGSRPDRRVFPLLLGAVFTVFTGQQLLGPVFPPLSRELGLVEVQFGLVIASASVAFALGSLFWGRVCDRWGQRRVLLTGLGLATAGLAGFAGVAAWGLGTDPPPVAVLLASMILMRSVFGLGLGAVPLAAIAYVGASTAGDAARTRMMSMVGAAEALAVVVGPGVAGLLSAGTLLGPLLTAPTVLGVVIVAAALVLPRAPGRAAAPTRSGGKLSPFDPRLRRFLAIGFLLVLSQGVVQAVVGFLFQDRLGLGATATAGAAGAAGVATGSVVVVVQGVVVPRLGWGPMRLLRVGAPIAVAGFALLAVAPGFWSMTAGLMVVALGLGMAMPGYLAGPALRLGPAEQGAVAGLVLATNGSTFVVSPLLGSAAYGFGPAAPVLLAVLLCGAACALLVRPVRPAAPAPDTALRG